MPLLTGVAPLTAASDSYFQTLYYGIAMNIVFMLIVMAGRQVELAVARSEFPCQP